MSSLTIQEPRKHNGAYGACSNFSDGSRTLVAYVYVSKLDFSEGGRWCGGRVMDICTLSKSPNERLEDRCHCGHEGYHCIQSKRNEVIHQEEDVKAIDYQITILYMHNMAEAIISVSLTLVEREQCPRNNALCSECKRA